MKGKKINMAKKGMKTIDVDDEWHSKLMMLKYEKKFKNMTEVIKYLYESSKI